MPRLCSRHIGVSIVRIVAHRLGQKGVSQSILPFLQRIAPFEIPSFCLIRPNEQGRIHPIQCRNRISTQQFDLRLHQISPHIGWPFPNENIGERIGQWVLLLLQATDGYIELSRLVIGTFAQHLSIIGHGVFILLGMYPTNGAQGIKLRAKRVQANRVVQICSRTCVIFE